MMILYALERLLHDVNRNFTHGDFIPLPGNTNTKNGISLQILFLAKLCQVIWALVTYL